MATVGTVTLVAAFTVSGGAAANASSPNPSASGATAPSCWLDVATQQSLCVPAGQDLIAAVRDQDGITLSVPVGTTVGGVTQTSGRIAADALTPAGAQVDTIVSGIFDDINYGGGVLYLSTPGSGCSWSLSDLGVDGWNDRASSFKSFNGCKTALYQNINFGGTHIGYATNDASFGSFNDQASSWKTE